MRKKLKSIFDHRSKLYFSFNAHPEFQILNDQPQFAEIDAESLVEVEAEYVDVPIDVPEVHLVTEVSCSTSG